MFHSHALTLLKPDFIRCLLNVEIEQKQAFFSPPNETEKECEGMVSIKASWYMLTHIFFSLEIFTAQPNGTQKAFFSSIFFFEGYTVES
jgi:hypothetical protein